MDVDAQAPVLPQDPAPFEMAAIGGVLQPAVAPRHDAGTQCSPHPSLVENGTQITGRHYTFKVNALLALLGTYEFLVSQERVAVRSRISHQPAFPYVRQALRAGRGPGVRLLTERPIAMSVFLHHREENDHNSETLCGLPGAAPRQAWWWAAGCALAVRSRPASCKVI
ncbi:hypothetical protein GWK47_016556 [Chionoecetes opilio]|uniref:Uncharacterized protein n=1 Tax=Chionoecetes opilio TaxID=41210 RepID=A0A8J4XTA3_CHIOP|nr:hypothetical protein GWK47_016556 [Chionoecetes opilio]